jgi:hypothetical protein
MTIFRDYFCPQCEYPMCGPSCSSGPNHSKECEIISRCKLADRPATLRIDTNQFERETNAYAIITPLRLLLLQEANDDKWHRSNQLMDHQEGKNIQLPIAMMIMSLEIHFVDRIKNAEEWLWYEKYIVNYFTNDLKLADRFTPAQIHRAIGLINVNAVALKFPMNSTRNASTIKYFVRFSAPILDLI